MSSSSLSTTLRLYKNYISPFYHEFITDIQDDIMDTNITEESKIKEFFETLEVSVRRFASPNYNAISVLVQIEDNFNRIFSLLKEEGNGYKKVDNSIQKCKLYTEKFTDTSRNFNKADR